MSKHTPGPWEWDSDPCNYDQHNEAPWLWQAPWETKESQRILQGSIKCWNEADARLIAAAPELLEALKVARGEVQYMAGGMTHSAWKTKQAQDALATIDAAIAKAEGKQ